MDKGVAIEVVLSTMVQSFASIYKIRISVEYFVLRFSQQSVKIT